MSSRELIQGISNGTRFTCSECNFQTYSRGNLKKHANAVHDKIKYKCCNILHFPVSTILVYDTPVYSTTTAATATPAQGSWDGWIPDSFYRWRPMITLGNCWHFLLLPLSTRFALQAGIFCRLPLPCWLYTLLWCTWWFKAIIFTSRIQRLHSLSTMRQSVSVLAKTLASKFSERFSIPYSLNVAHSRTY